MKKRGRPSLASMSIVAPTAVPRLLAPSDLSDEDCEHWTAIVEAMPADWFSKASVPVLAQLCRHITQSKNIANLIEKGYGDPQFEFDSFKALLAMQREESKMIALLSTKLRLTPQSTTNHRGNPARKPATFKPWEHV